MKLIVMIIRAFQLLFAVVVLGLSISLAKGQVVGHAPATTGYSAFTGGLGIVAALIGIGALFLSPLEGIVSWVFDGLAALCFMAGGIAMVLGLRGTKCSDPETLQLKAILNGGGAIINKVYECGYCGSPNYGKIQSRCRDATADDAFMWMGFIITLFAIGVGFMSGSSRFGGSRTIV